MMNTLKNSKKAIPFLAAILLCISMMHSPSFSGERKGAEQESVSTDQIFTDIMQTLPSDLQSKVEKANHRMEEQNGEEAAREQDAERERVQEQQRQELNELPEDVQKKVEKAMDDMEDRAKERQLRFKDLKK